MISTAEKQGIPWSHTVAQLQASEVFQIREELEHPDVQYPDYYNVPFHGCEPGCEGRVQPEPRVVAVVRRTAAVMGGSWGDEREAGWCCNGFPTYPEPRRQALHPPPLPDNEGNMNWLAAFECEPAGLSMAWRAYKDRSLTPQVGGQAGTWGKVGRWQGGGWMTTRPGWGLEWWSRLAPTQIGNR